MLYFEFNVFESICEILEYYVPKIDFGKKVFNEENLGKSFTNFKQILNKQIENVNNNL